MARVLRRVLLRHPNTTRRLLLAQGLGDLLPVHLGERVAHDLGAAARLAGVLLFVLVQAAARPDAGTVPRSACVISGSIGRSISRPARGGRCKVQRMIAWVYA